MRTAIFGFMLLLLTSVSPVAEAIDLRELRMINHQVNLDYQRQQQTGQRYSHSALAKYHLVRQRFPDARMMITHAQHVTPSGYEIEPHTVVTVEADNRIWVMDYELLNIYTAEDRRDLKPVTSIELRGDQVWIHHNHRDWSIQSSQPADPATEARLRSTLLNSAS
ncbi:hypothetical protein [Nitrincola iocasae]|uniref:DUF4440 domain-containing protein n=1 Tax=Nitrincola iocasae TaxID=2614693 RepID=A0A5J6LGT6_9GAMM|nr:hypothetical protein [Nitrincola iocasae]QEW07805.1 hypothetical protein F5I99_15630 [Nitrincola iocasae]